MPGRFNRVASLLLALTLAAGCGYLRAGTWENAPSNWRRVFHSTKPDDVVILHSRYWRSAHWSYEAGYVFEIAANSKLRDQLFRENRLRRLEGAAAAEAKQLCSPACLLWFAPTTIEEYEVWAMPTSRAATSVF